MVVDGPLAVTSIGGADGPGRAEYHTIVVDSLPPASSVIAVTVVLTSLLPAPLEAVTVMVYLLSSSRPGIRASVYALYMVKSHVICVQNSSKLSENDSPWLQNH